MEQSEEYKALKQQMKEIQKRIKELEAEQCNRGLTKLERRYDRYHLSIAMVDSYTNKKRYMTVSRSLYKNEMMKWITERINEFSFIKEFLEKNEEV